ncbi:YbaB/EbfC family nucleoid-associated protein [Prauserella cavernicola]|uniref:YbaB/EbfC family nucleoid-associated protein n=1 Tax=Prauserella cavernicola TaxID=2800127 RepID=A0A934QYT4_9PSEU|nr:YbaB/EbfC family nucleoid-associated protein [Prauserella cavernicola]MBK1787784.1 YbaB/EbfC family nucleoid-associated protein [Prauserella cavernicola]
MFSPLHNQLDEAMREMRAKQEELAGAFGKLQDVTATATSKDRAIQATVDSQGKLTELTLNGKRWRDMAPKELAAKIVEVVTDAQDEAAAATSSAMAGLIPEGLDLEKLRESGPDLDAMFDEALKDARKGRQ